MDYKRLGERIREERLRLHLTQARLAEDVDISDTYMGAIERGERSLTLRYPGAAGQPPWRHGGLSTG